MFHSTGQSHHAPIVDTERCHVCKICAARRECRGGALRVIDQGEPPVVDVARCRSCLMCVNACPFGAIVRYDPTHTV